MRNFHHNGKSLALGDRGMAATSHPLSTLAAIDILKQGGNAVDAAIAAGAVQAVVDPAMTGVAGDAFIIMAPADGGLVCVNGNGKAPLAADAAAIRARSGLEMAQTSPDAVTIPCGVSAWFNLHATHGRLEMAQILAPAIDHAENGFRIAPRVAAEFAASHEILESNPTANDFYLLGGKIPGVGDRLQLPKLGQTLRDIAAGGEEVFYRGHLAEKMVRTLNKAGGVHSLDDFASASAYRTDPITSNYRGLDLFQCPPSGQGIIALLMLNVLEGFDLSSMDPNGAERFHLEAEITKLAFLERQTHLADPDMADVPTETLLSKEFAAHLRSKIDLEKTTTPEASAIPGHEDTVYLTVVDGDLNAVSFIQSLYSNFGTGICCPETGMLFHCRGRGFTLEEGHKNELMPGKRPMHTIIPGMAFKDGEAFMSFGVMGADYQPVGQTHVVSNIVDFGMDAQAALDSPRVMAYPTDLAVEATVDPSVRAKLTEMGHGTHVADMPFGSGQAIVIDRKRGVLMGGGDHRKDSVALGY